MEKYKCNHICVGMNNICDCSFQVCHTKKNRGHSGWKAALFIFAGQALESLAFLEIVVNLFHYLLTSMHLPITISANGVTNFKGSALLLTLLGGYISDTWLGKFETIIISVMIYLLGCVLILLSASVTSLRPPPCLTLSSSCKEANTSQKCLLFLGLYLIALGGGGVKSNLPPMGAAQFQDETESAGGTDQLSKFFNWFGFSIAVGYFISVTIGVYIIDNVSRSWGFAIPAAAMLLSLLFISAGYNFYKKGARPSASGPVTQIAQVLVAACRNRNLPRGNNGEDYLYEVHNKADQYHLCHSDKFLFLDKAARMTTYPGCGEAVNPWKLRTVTQVEEVKVVLSFLPIFVSTIMMSCALAQLSTFYIGQSRTLDRRISEHFEIPAASLTLFPIAGQMITILFYNQLVTPIARKFTKNKQGITHLRRVGLGLLLSIFSTITAAFVEEKRIKIAKQHFLLDNPTARIPLKLYWIVPQYLIFGTAEALAVVGMLEFFYSEAPPSMRTIATSLTFVSQALGNFLSSALVSAVQKATKGRSSPDLGWLPNNLNRSKLANFYWLLTALGSISFLNYVFWAWRYKSRVAAEETHSKQLDHHQKGNGFVDNLKLELTINPPL
ncbi:hypothetical protein O6H91_02G038000 [Diphasiastrum complanatum]|uniref:Uncharacterized protein n=1 Tax=Diphasiastrum complanatum TaxID=34168 RepID=A0ACC2EEK2_DIPCM|nr:hypothetical protein O6H91_02G038000 [Diphasiastrum complanatum]